jgi:putative transposase
MKKSRYTEEQLIGILKQHEAGVKTADVCREHGISAATFYGWKSKYGGMDVSEAQRLKAMEDENRRLKLLVAELSLHGEALKAVIRKNGWSLPEVGVPLGRVPTERTHGLQAAGRGAVELSI